MQYYQPIEILDKVTKKGTGLWHYVAIRDGKPHPVGYCAQNCSGHTSPEQARLHFKLYVIDNAHYDSTMEQMLECEVCHHPTNKVVTYGPGWISYKPLCDSHRNKNTLSGLIGNGDWVASA